MHSLPLFHRIGGQRVVVVGDGDSAQAKRRLVERAGGIPCSEAEAHHARLAFVALEEAREGEAETIALRLRRRGLLVNVADRPDLCDFTLPSVLDREPVLMAIGTGGASAGLAKHLRLRLEALLPEGVGRLAKALFAGREELRARHPDPAARRRALDVALTEGGPLDPFDPDASRRVVDWLAGTLPDGQEPSRLVEIVLSSNDPDDLTLGQARALGMADRVLHAENVPETILLRARADAVRERLADAFDQRPGLTVLLRRR